MFPIVIELLEILAPVLIILGVGAWWGRSGRVFDSAMVSGLVMNLGAPALVFHTLSTVDVAPRDMTLMGGGVLAAMAVFALLGIAGLRWAQMPVRTYLPSLMFPNIGNMGLPICLFAYGEEGLALGVVIFAVVSIAYFTVGVWISSRESSLRGLLLSPLIYAVVAALAMNYFGAELPPWLERTTGMLGQITIPLMLLTLGVSLSSMRVSDLRLSLILGVARVWFGAGVGLGLAALLDLSGPARGVLVLQCAMPAAVFSYILAQQYDREPRQIAGVVVVSTAVAFVTLPVLIIWLSRSGMAVG